MQYKYKNNPQSRRVYRMKILWATVIYPSPMFDVFLEDHLTTINNQTYQNFDLLLFLDCISKYTIEKTIKKNSNLYNTKIEYIQQEMAILNPMEIRKEILLYAHKHNYDLLIFSDFDETMDANRVEETIKQIGNFDFSFSSFYATDFRLKKIENVDFHTKCQTPKIVSDILPITDKNFIGLGNMSIKINHPIFSNLNYLKLDHCHAFDWMIATFMLLHGLQGIRIDNTFVNYRQYQNSYIGIFKPLNKQTLDVGVMVKKSHYYAFKNLYLPFVQKYNEIVELEKYLVENENNYIKIINQNFNPATLCWWENIKTLEEIKQWI